MVVTTMCYQKQRFEEAGIFLVTAVELVEIWWKLDFRYEMW